MRIITITPVFLLLAFGASLSMAGSPAQNKSVKKKPGHVSNSSPAVGKLRARSEQPPVSNVVQSPNENSIGPTETKGDEEPGKPADSNASEAPANRSSEKPAGAKPLLPAADTKGTNASQESLTSLRDQIEATPNGSERVRLQLKVAEQLVAAGKKTEAAKELSAIINADVFDPQVLYNAGNALARIGDSDEAIKAYRKAIDQRKGNYSRALNNLAVILLRQGRWDDAHDALLSASQVGEFSLRRGKLQLGTSILRPR